MTDLYPISIYIIFLQIAIISYRVLSSFQCLWGWNMTFSDVEIKELGRKNLEWYPQHNLIHPYLSSISQTSCRRKKPSRWKSIKTHTHTHTHPPTHPPTHTHTHTHSRSIIVLKAALSKRQPLKMILSWIQMFHVLIIVDESFSIKTNNKTLILKYIN